MQPINMIIIYYSDKKLPKRLYFLEANMITIKTLVTECIVYMFRAMTL